MVDRNRFTPQEFEYDFERDKLHEHRVTFEEAVECFFEDHEIRRNKRYRDRFQLIGRTIGGRRLKIVFQLKPGRNPHHYRLAIIDMPKTKPDAALDQESIDTFVASQASDDSAWGPPVRVSRSQPAAVSLPGELAARAAFLAKLHRATGIDQWIERVVRERVELEESAFAEAKRRLAS
ncbi:MAG: hypothetical protein ACLP59_14695 [Bryobacteraceae bacterium]